MVQMHFQGAFFCASFPAPFFAMSELGEALEADAIIQALGVFFFQRFSLELSIAMCDASVV